MPSFLETVLQAYPWSACLAQCLPACSKQSCQANATKTMLMHIMDVIIWYHIPSHCGTSACTAAWQEWWLNTSAAQSACLQETCQLCITDTAADFALPDKQYTNGNGALLLNRDRCDLQTSHWGSRSSRGLCNDMSCNNWLNFHLVHKTV